MAKDKSSNARDMQLYWIQKQHVAGDNSFNPYVLYAKELSDHVHESHRAEDKSQNDRDDKSPKRKSISALSKFFKFPGRTQNKKQDSKPYHKTTFAVVIGVLGFVAQFQGLRFSNWSWSVAQLIALGIATFLRAWVRRGMTKTPVAVPINDEYILDSLTLAMIGKGPSGYESPNTEAFRSPGLSFAFGVTTAPTLRAIPKPEFSGQVQPRGEPSNRAVLAEVRNQPTLAQQALNLRVRLGLITEWSGTKSQEAIILSNSIDTALKRLNFDRPRAEKCVVVLNINTYRRSPYARWSSMVDVLEEVELTMTKDGDKWRVDEAELEALLALVSYSARTAEEHEWSHEEKHKREGSTRSDSSRHQCTEAQTMENNRSIGWLRAKVPDAQIYDVVVGKSSPRLLSDLYWWTSDAVYLLKKVKIENGIPAIPSGSSLVSQATNVERPALGCYVNDETSGGIGMTIIQLLI